MTAQERFAEEWGIDIDRVGTIVRLAKECAQINERYCNGDPHPRNPNPEDKSRNAELWGNTVAVAANDLLRFAESYGFTGVVFTGLGPTLKRGERFVEIPY